MMDTRVHNADIYCESGLGSDDYLEITEKDINLKRAMAIVENFPWEKEYASLLEEDNDFSGCISISKGPIKEDGHVSLIMYPVEAHKININLNIVLKKKFLGIFGGKGVYASAERLTIDEASEYIKVFFSKDINGLYEFYKN